MTRHTHTVADDQGLDMGAIAFCLCAARFGGPPVAYIAQHGRALNSKMPPGGGNCRDGTFAHGDIPPPPPAIGAYPASLD